jgi:hypothetical protein
MHSFITTRDQIADMYNTRGEIGLQCYLSDLGFDCSRPIKFEGDRGKVEFWQAEDDLLIVPQNSVINGSQRRYMRNHQLKGRRNVLI